MAQSDPLLVKSDIPAMNKVRARVGRFAINWTRLPQNGTNMRLINLCFQYILARRFYLYLYKYENVCVYVCVCVCFRVFLSHFETIWDTLLLKVAFWPRKGFKTIIFQNKFFSQSYCLFSIFL